MSTASLVPKGCKPCVAFSVFRATDAHRLYRAANGVTGLFREREQHRTVAVTISEARTVKLAGKLEQLVFYCLQRRKQLGKAVVVQTQIVGFQ